MNLDELSGFYQAQCKSLMVTEGVGGALQYDETTFVEAGEIIPLAIKHKKENLGIYFPTRDRLRNPSDQQVIFDPLSENILRKISPLQQRLMTIMGIAIERYVAEAVDLRLRFALEPDLQKRLTPAQSRASDLPEDLIPTKTAREQWDAIARKVGMQAERDHRYFLAALQKNVDIDGTKYGRGCMCRFPIYEALQGEKVKEVFGVKISAKNGRIFRHLLESLLPDIADNSYSRGSDNDQAPYYSAFTLMSHGLLLDLYNNAKSFGMASYFEHLEDYLNYEFIVGSTKEFNEAMVKMSRVIPAQDGASGAEVETDTPKAEPKAKSRASSRLSRPTEDEAPPWDEDDTPRRSARALYEEPQAPKRDLASALYGGGGDGREDRRSRRDERGRGRGRDRGRDRGGRSSRSRRW